MIDRREGDGRAWKCTLCYDRLKEGMEPACAKACPTDSIKFGDLDELARNRPRAASSQLHEQRPEGGVSLRRGCRQQPGTEGLNAFFLLVDRPEVYNLPPEPVAPAKCAKEAWKSFAFAALGLVGVALAGALAAARPRG